MKNHIVLFTNINDYLPTSNLLVYYILPFAIAKYIVAKIFHYYLV